jgi:hypothetical protein
MRQSTCATLQRKNHHHFQVNHSQWAPKKPLQRHMDTRGLTSNHASGTQRLQLPTAALQHNEGAQVLEGAEDHVHRSDEQHRLGSGAARRGTKKNPVDGWRPRPSSCCEDNRIHGTHSAQGTQTRGTSRHTNSSKPRHAPAMEQKGGMAKESRHIEGHGFHGVRMSRRFGYAT